MSIVGNGISNKRVKLMPPWEEYYQKLVSLFAYDKDITVIANMDDEDEENEKSITIQVDSFDKYEALIHLLPEEKEFGNITVKIKIIPANDDIKKDHAYYLKRLFKGNKAVNDICDVHVGGGTMPFIEFKRFVVQYYNDDLGDLHGNRSTLMQELAKEVFEDHAGVYFSTANYDPDDIYY